MANICTWVAPLTIGILRFLCVLNLAKGRKGEEENICYCQLSQLSIQTPLAVTSSYFETLKKCCLV